MYLKNKNEINKDICQSVLDSVKNYEDTKIQYYLNNSLLLSRRKLNYDELKNKDDDKLINNRKEYINAVGVIASTVRIDAGEKLTNVHFDVSDRSNAKTKIDWDYADAINKLTNKQYFKEDFKTIRNFAKVSNLKAPFISKMRSASSFKKAHKNNPDIQALDVYQAVILNSLGFELELFVEAYGGYEEIRKTPYRQLEKEISDYKKPAFYL